jgi:hypothetical protein
MDFIWAAAQQVAVQVAEGERSVEKVLVLEERHFSIDHPFKKKPLLFNRVHDYMPLACPFNWTAPFPTFCRLACFRFFANRIYETVNRSLLKDPANIGPLCWTYWLHMQSIEHLDYLIGEKHEA